MRFTVFVLWVVGLSSHLWAVDSAPSDWVAQAASTYQAALETPDRNHRVQKFSEAEALFTKAISTVRDSSASQSSSDASAELYVNLGNAALGAEHLGLRSWPIIVHLWLTPTMAEQNKTWSTRENLSRIGFPSLTKKYY